MAFFIRKNFQIAKKKKRMLYFLGNFFVYIPCKKKVRGNFFSVHNLKFRDVRRQNKQPLQQ